MVTVRVTEKLVCLSTDDRRGRIASLPQYFETLADRNTMGMGCSNSATSDCRRYGFAVASMAVSNARSELSFIQNLGTAT